MKFLEALVNTLFRHSRESGSPVKSKSWIPAFAGVTNSSLLSSLLALLMCSTFTSSYALDFGQQLRDKLKEQLPEQVKEQVRSVADVLGKTSQNDEIAIGRQIAGNLLGVAPLVKDAGLQQYVNRVGRWVANQSERPDLPWHFGVIESTDVNAFAAPGGYIFVTRGLYTLLQNEAELAGVLAHEVGHVISKHHLKILQKSRLLDLGSQALAKKVSNNDNVQKFIGSGAEITARSLDQDAEFEADRIAVVLTARAGYDAFALPSVLQQIGHYAVDNDSVALLFKTHPHPDTRLQTLGGAMGDRFDSIKGQILPKRLYKLTRY